MVVLPASTEEVAAVIRIARDAGMPVVPRGAGTGLSGGALPVPGCVLLGLSRMKRILEVDLDDGWIRVQPGVINLDVSKEISAAGYYYAPDPSSQSVCTIGGNVAENSGGAHCLKYGFTVNHVLGARLVTADGAVIDLGGPALDTPGYDLLGVVVGSEGTLGIVTEVTLRVLRKPETTRTFFATFPSTTEGGHCVSEIISTGIVPAAIEMMDRLAIRAAVAATGVDWPDVGAALLMDVDGCSAETEHTSKVAVEIARRTGALEIRVPRSEDERCHVEGAKAPSAPWGGWPAASCRTGIPEGHRPGPGGDRRSRRRLRVANVFHAGDGNLHPGPLRRQGAGQSMPRRSWPGDPPDHPLRRLDHRRAQSARTRRPTWRRCSARTTWTPWPRCAAPSTQDDVPSSKDLPPRLCGDSRGSIAPPDRGGRAGGPGMSSLLQGLESAREVRPRSLAEATEAMQEAARASSRVLFVGGGTELGIGPVPSGLDLLFRTDGLDKVVELAPLDQIVVVEAGVTVAALQRLLGAQGQMLALDPPWPERATVGGVVATNAFGARRTRYGSVRDLIIGISIVRADGTSARGGGKVVKNVAGFDVPKLMVGSLGTLGLIATVTFRLHPKPESAGRCSPRPRRRNRPPAGAQPRQAQLEPTAVAAWSARGTDLGCASTGGSRSGCASRDSGPGCSGRPNGSRWPPVRMDRGPSRRDAGGRLLGAP